MATGQEGRCLRWRLTIAAADRYANLRIGYVDTVVGWREELGEPAMTKLMWENASRFLRLASTPWGD